MTIKLTPEIRLYAQAVGKIGERMGKTSEGFGKVAERKVASLGDIEEMKADYRKLLNEFISQENDLEGLYPPQLLIAEHQKLVSSYDKYVSATRKDIDSLDVNSTKTDESLLKEAQSMQWEASREIVDVSNTIAEKLGLK